MHYSLIFIAAHIPDMCSWSPVNRHSLNCHISPKLSKNNLCIVTRQYNGRKSHVSAARNVELPRCPGPQLGSAGKLTLCRSRV